MLFFFQIDWCASIQFIYVLISFLNYFVYNFNWEDPDTLNKVALFWLFMFSYFMNSCVLVFIKNGGVTMLVVLLF